MLISRGARVAAFLSLALISVYALSSGLITAIGRVGFGVEQALSNRYAVFSLFIYLGLVELRLRSIATNKTGPYLADADG